MLVLVFCSQEPTRK